MFPYSKLLFFTGSPTHSTFCRTGHPASPSVAWAAHTHPSAPKPGPPPPPALQDSPRPPHSSLLLLPLCCALESEKGFEGTAGGSSLGNQKCVSAFFQIRFMSVSASAAIESRGGPTQSGRVPRPACPLAGSGFPEGMAGREHKPSRTRNSQ